MQKETSFDFKLKKKNTQHTGESLARHPKTEGRTKGLVADTDLAEKLLHHLLIAALGLLLGGTELLFGVRPFGIGLAAAASEFLPSAAAGVALYCLIYGDYLTLGALALLLGLRVMLSLLPGAKTPLFAERPLLRVVTAAAATLPIGIATLITGGWRYYDLFGVLLATAAAPLSAALYHGIFKEKQSLFPDSHTVGCGAVLLTVIFSLKTVSVFGIYPAAVAAAATAFLLTAQRGLLRGSMAGLLCGLAFDPRLAPAFLLCGIAFGLLEKSSRGGAVLAGGASAAAYAFFVSKSEGAATLLPALLTAGALFLATDSAGLIEGSPARRLTVTRRRAATGSAKSEAQRAVETHLAELSTAFTELSGTLYELSGRTRRPSAAELGRLCDRALGSTCPTCSRRGLCWGEKCENSPETVSKLGKSLHQNGLVTKEDFPEGVRQRCTELTRLVAIMNDDAAKLAEDALRGDQTTVVAMDYAAMGRVLADTLAENGEDFSCDLTAGERIVQKLQRAGYTLESAVVCGTVRRRVILRGLRLPGQHPKLRDIRRIVEKICRFPLGEPQTAMSEGLSDIVFPEKARFRTHTAKLCRPKNQQDRHCGDSATCFSTERGYDYSLLCDGMGSGNAAALTSALSSTFLSRLLQAGSRAENSLRMLNGLLGARGRRERESSTTVDLLEIDSICGEASLFKCGAAPTYLLREGELTRFFSRTAPVGILETLDAERIRFEVREGDVLLQVSDGFTDGEEDCPWLSNLLLTEWNDDPEEFARLALSRAVERCSDDLSIAVTVVSANDVSYRAKSA